MWGPSKPHTGIMWSRAITSILEICPFMGYMPAPWLLTAHWRSGILGAKKRVTLHHLNPAHGFLLRREVTFYYGLCPPSAAMTCGCVNPNVGPGVPIPLVPGQLAGLEACFAYGLVMSGGHCVSLVVSWPPVCARPGWHLPAHTTRSMRK